MTRCGAHCWQLIARGKVLLLREETGQGTGRAVFSQVSEENPQTLKEKWRVSEECLQVRKEKMQAPEEGPRIQAEKREPEAVNSFLVSTGEAEFHELWEPYFDLKTDYAAYRSCALSGDACLQRALQYGTGIRVLRQDPWETLISFIISQRRSVPAIRTAVRKLSERFGKEIRVGSRLRKEFDIPEEQRFYAFPAPKALAKAPTEEIAACGLGYRTDYVKAAAQAVWRGELDLEAISALSDAALLEELTRLPGVGIKVASCTALFGYHRLRIAPVDVWIRRIFDTNYADFGGKFPEEYESCAGVLQQYLFHYARMTKRVETV